MLTLRTRLPQIRNDAGRPDPRHTVLSAPVGGEYIVPAASGPTVVCRP